MSFRGALFGLERCCMGEGMATRNGKGEGDSGSPSGMTKEGDSVGEGRGTADCGWGRTCELDAERVRPGYATAGMGSCRAGSIRSNEERTG